MLIKDLYNIDATQILMVALESNIHNANTGQVLSGVFKIPLSF